MAKLGDVLGTAIPKNVRRFEWLMYGALILGLIYAPFSDRVRFARDHYGATAGAYAFAVLLLLYVGIIWAIVHRRQNWLRYAVLIFFLLGLFSLIDVFQQFSYKPVSSLISFVQLSMHGVACYFVFTGDAIPWFKQSVPTLGDQS
jgi:hypothetical protein